MNFIYGVAASAGTLIILLMLYLVAPKQLLPRKKAHKKILLSAIGTIVMYVIWSRAMTYGPRIEVDAAVIPAPPERVLVESTGNIFGSEDKFKKFEYVIDKNNERQQKFQPNTK